MPRPIPLLLSVILACPAALAQGLPQRIVSMNLCTDQLLLLLVDKSRIASVSRFVADPSYSWIAPQAAAIPTNRGQAEEVLSFAPDLILTSQFSATLAANLLERLGHRVERLGFANSAADIHVQIRQVAALTGSTDAGELLISQLQAGMATGIEELRPRLSGKTAAFYASNGYSYGTGTLQDEFLTSVGLRNVAAEAGIQGPALLPLEALLAATPDYLLTDPRSSLDSQLANPLLDHPALTALGNNMRVLEVPDTWFQCAGPQLAEAYRGLARQLANDQ